MSKTDNKQNNESFKDDSYLPSCWNDDARMNALFAPFRNKSVNPQDWESKLVFWKNSIASWCAYKNRCTFTISDLNEAFIRNGCAPGCLPSVINEMMRLKDIHTLKEFVETTSNNTWSSWMVYTLLKKPVFWSFNKLKSSIVASDVSSETLIHINSIHKQSDTLLKNIPSDLKNTVIDLDMLKERNILDEQNSELDVLLNYLITSHKIDVKKVHNTVLIKVYDGEKDKRPISNIDIGIYKLQQQEHTILNNLEKLEIEKGLAITEAKSYLAKGHRQMAKTCLRKKHEVEKRIDKRAAALDNVQILLAKVKDSEGDAAILDAYKLGLSALKTTFKEAGLSEDSVSDTMLELGEVLEIHDDIEKALAQPCLDVYDVDLEQELAELMADDANGNSNAPKPPRKLPNEEEEEAEEGKELDEDMKKLNIKLPDVPLDVSSENEIDLLTTSP